MHKVGYLVFLCPVNCEVRYYQVNRVTTIKSKTKSTKLYNNVHHQGQIDCECQVVGLQVVLFDYDLPNTTEKPHTHNQRAQIMMQSVP